MADQERPAAARALDEGTRFGAICHPDALTALFTAAGLREVEWCAIDVQTDFRDFDDFWSPFLGGQGPAPAYVSVLSAVDRAALRERLRAAIPTASNGAIHLSARAWAASGKR